MAANTKVYRVKFETEGFKQVAESLQQVQKGIRNTTAEALKSQARQQDLSVIRSQSARNRDRDIFGGKFVRQGEGSPHSRQSIIRSIQEGLGFKQEPQAKKEGLTFGSAFLIGVADALEIKSPSRAMFRIGQQAALGFREGFESVPDHFRAIQKVPSTRIQAQNGSEQHGSRQSVSSAPIAKKLDREQKQLNKSLDRSIDSTVAIHRRQINLASQIRDSRGRFIKTRLGISADRLSHVAEGEKGYSDRRFDFRYDKKDAQSRTTLEVSARIQGEIIGQHIKEALTSDKRLAPSAQSSERGVRDAIVNGLKFSLESYFSGAFEELGAASIARPITAAIQKGFATAAAKAAKDAKKSTGIPVIGQATGATKFAATSVAFGAFQQFGAKFSADFASGFIRGFDKRADQEFGFSLERRGEIFGGSVVDLAKNLANDMDEAAQEFQKAEKNLENLSEVFAAAAKVATQPVDTAIRSYRRNAINTVALDRAKERAKQEEPADLSGKEEALFVVGGFAARQGKAGIGIARKIQKTVDRDKTAVIPVENPYTDITSDAAESPKAWAAEMLTKIARLTAQGFNEDAVNMAAKVAATKQANPEVKIRLVGHSAGGFVVEEAQEILRQMGIEVESVSLGTPNPLGGLRTGQGRYMGAGDPLAKANDYLRQVGFAGDYTTMDTVQGHSFPDYMVPEVEPILSDHKRPEKKAAPPKAKQEPDPEFVKVQAEARAMFVAFEAFRAEVSQRAKDMAGQTGDPNEALNAAAREAAQMFEAFENLRSEMEQRIQPSQGGAPRIDPDAVRSHIERQFEEAASLHAGAIARERELKQSRNVTPTPQDIPISVAPDSPRPTNIPIDVGESDLDRERRKENLLNIRRLRAEARQQFKRVAEMQRRAQENAKKLEPSQLAAQQASTPQTFADEAELPQLIEAYQMTLANAVKESGKAMLDSLQSTMEMLSQSAVDGGEEVASEFVLQVNQSFYTYADKVKKSYIKALAAMRGVSANAGKGVGRGNFKQTLEQLRTDFDAILGELQTEMVVQVRDIISSMDLLLENYEQNYAPPMLAGATNRPDVERFDQLLQDQVMAFQESLEKLLVEIVRARTGSITDLQGDRARVGLPAQAAPQPPQPKAPIGQRYQEYLTGKLQSAKQSAAERVRAIFPVFKQMNLERRDEALKAMKSRVKADMDAFRQLMAEGDRRSARQLGEGLIQRIEAIKEAYDQIGKQIGNTKKVGGHKSEMTKFSNELKRGLTDIAENATGTFADEIEGSLGGVGDAGESMGDAFLEEIRNAFDIQSPSKKMQEIGENVVAGLEQGLKKIGDVTANAANAALTKIKNLLANVKNLVGQGMRRIGLSAKKEAAGISGAIVPYDRGALAPIEPDPGSALARVEPDLGSALARVEPNPGDGKIVLASRTESGIVKAGPPKPSAIAGEPLKGNTKKATKTFVEDIEDRGKQKVAEVRENLDAMFDEASRPVEEMENRGKAKASKARAKADSFFNRIFGFMKDMEIRGERKVVDATHGAKHAAKGMGADARDTVDDLESRGEKRVSEAKKRIRSLFDSVSEFLSDLEDRGEQSAAATQRSIYRNLKEVAHKVGANMGVELRGNIGLAKDILIDQLKDLGEEVVFQVKRRANKFKDDGGVEKASAVAADWGAKARENVDMARDALIDQLRELAEEVGFQVKRGVNKFEDAGGVEKIKSKASYWMGEIGDEINFQARRGLNKIQESGGIKGLDKQAAEGVAFLRSEVDALLERVPFLKNLPAIGIGVGGAITIAAGAFALLSKAIELTGIGDFVSAIATLPGAMGYAGKESESLALAFESVTGSSDRASEAMSYVSSVASRFAIDVRSAEEAYLGLLATTRGTELEGFQTDQIFEAFAQTAALRGIDQQQQQQMFTAVQQILGKGKLSAEEVRGQLGEIPALAFQQTLADALGVNLQQLDKMLSQGQIGADALFKVAQTYVAANAQIAQGSGTAEQASTRFGNAVVALQRSFGKQTLDIQRNGMNFFAGALEKLAGSAELLVGILKGGLVMVLGKLTLTLYQSLVAMELFKAGVNAVFKSVLRFSLLLIKLLAGIALVVAAVEALSILQEEFGLTDADKQVAALSARYQELAGSIGAAAKAQEEFSFRGALRSGASNFVDGFVRFFTLGMTKAPSERLNSLQANRSVARSIEQTSVANLAISEQSAGVKAAEKLLQIEQDMVDVRSYRISLTANDGAELERTKKQLEDLRKEADRYQESVSQARSNADAALQASKAVVEQLRSRYADSLTEEEKQELQEQIDAQLKNINLLEQGQQELDLATSRVSRNLSTIATLVSRVGQRVAAFQENLANAFNEYRTQLIETGLNLGLGEQTIRLQIEQADIRELQDRIATLRREAQDLERKAEHPDIAPQVKNIRDRAEREGTQIGIEFLQAIISENLEDTEAAQLMLQTLEVQGQVRQDEYQLMQQMLQSRQSIRDSNRSIFDFLRQLDQEFTELQLQLQEQLADLKNAFRRSQLQRLLVPGSTGLFGDVVQGIQGLLDQAAEVATRYLGQERRRLEISQRRYDLSTRLEDFRNSLGGATDALNGFTAALTGRTEASAGVPGSSSFGSFPSPGGATTGGEVLLGFTGNTGSSTGPHLDIRKRGGYRQLTDAELNRFNVDGRSLTSYPVTSAYGNRTNPVTGNQQFHQGIDFGINTGGKITTTVPVRSVSLRDPSQTGGGGWVTDVVFEDGLEVSLLHLDPSTQGAGVGRRSVGSPSGISSTGATFSASRRMTIGQLVGIAQAAGFNEDDARIMAAIAMGESSGDPMAHNPTNMDNSYGLWQINMLGAMGPERRQQFGLSSNEQLFDPATNARAAKAIFDSQGWGAWGAYTNGSYRQYLSQAQSVPTTPITNRDAVQAQSTADAIMQTSERMASVDSSQTTVAVINLLVGAKNAVEELRRSLRTGRRDMLNSSRGILTSLEQYLNPDTLTQAIQQNENTFIDFGNQVEVERERIQDTATQLHLLMDPATGLPAMIQQLRASGDEADEVVANSLEEQLNLVRETSEVIDRNLEVFDTKATERRIEEARQRELQYVTEKTRLETENAQIAVDLENAQARNNIEGERGLAIAQERNNLQLRLLELNRELAGRPDILSERIESETRKTEIAIRTLEFQAQQKALSERQYQNDISNQLLEAQATQAEGPRGDNGLFGFRAQGLREEAALLQEQLRYEQQILELRQRYQDPVFAGLLTQLEGQAAAIRDINIQNIDNQFKDLGETIEEVGTSSLSSFFNELFTGTQTIGQALRGLVSSVLKSLAQIAAQNVARSIVGRIAGAIGGAIGGGGQAAFTSPAGWSGWKYGGTIPAYAEGGRVVPDGISSTLREILPGMNSSFMREGSGAVLGVFTPGEEVLSLKTGEAQRYQALKRALGPNPLHSVMAGNFAFGGTVGINPDILSGNVGRSSPYLPVSAVTQLGSSRGGFGGQNVTVNYQVNTPDANSFRKSQFQINRDATLEAQRLLARR